MKYLQKGRRKEQNGMYKHGLSKTRLHKTWDGIKYRCYNPNATSYKNYGGRGIKMCDEWKDSFIAFYEWAMANGYNDSMTIERIDNDGNYCPENCKWIPPEEQAKNRRCSINITYKGVTKDIADWANESGIKYATLYRRYRLGWCADDMFTIPVNYRCRA